MYSGTQPSGPAGTGAVLGGARLPAAATVPWSAEVTATAQPSAAAQTKAQAARARWGFWALWVLATVAGFAVAEVTSVRGPAAVSDVVRGTAIAAGLSNLPGHVLRHTLTGVMLGAMQWFLLRRRVVQARWWVVASTLTFLLGGLIPLSQPITAVDWATVGAVDGVLLGGAQWLLLRRQYAGAGWWFVALAASLPVALAVGFTAGQYSYLLAGTLTGGVTGLVMLWLLRRPLAAE